MLVVAGHIGPAHVLWSKNIHCCVSSDLGQIDLVTNVTIMVMLPLALCGLIDVLIGVDYIGK